MQGRLGPWITRTIRPQPSWNRNQDHFFGNAGFDIEEQQQHHFSSGFQHDIQPSTMEDTFPFDGLAPDTEYEVKIQAKNSYGWSDNEPDFVFKTSHRGLYFGNTDNGMTMKKVERRRTFL